ncbi:response regulator transcription factor [Taibaiella lutea]|uniref:Response regulator transcription factor n=1 Tax=Taibaiella lutea TaxID=2608001 RepID=A0A5M6CPQ1_9BACT|nr:response regulator transcription factor [Taibaiella lutea]KAA5535109.1 response regulator transcription factor [Taibaiella lutea]
MTKLYTDLYLADDHQIIIDGLKLLISNNPKIRIVGSATNGDTAYTEILQKKPDIAIIDLRMPGQGGLELINSLKKHVETRFIILSMHNDKRYITDAINYGAAGYIVKNTGKSELMTCLDKVMSGGQFFTDISGNKPQDKKMMFTPRELDIIRLIIAELTTNDIAKQLYLSPYTVETHRKNICRKAGAKTVIGLLKYMQDNGLEL